MSNFWDLEITIAMNLLRHHISTFLISRTPLMAAMHEDSSPDLSEVGRMLEENLQVKT